MGMTWQEICNHPALADLPFKIESDEWGNIVMSPPAGADHCDFQGEVVAHLLRLLPSGRARSEYPLQTAKGVKAIDAVWVSRDRLGQKPKGSLIHLIAPEICVEVLSPKNSRAEINEKIRLYFERNAQECWICDRKGNMTFFAPTGQIDRSRLCPKFPIKVEQS